MRDSFDVFCRDDSCCIGGRAVSRISLSRDCSNVCALQVYSASRIAGNICNRIRAVLNGYHVLPSRRECVRSTDLISIADWFASAQTNQLPARPNAAPYSGFPCENPAFSVYVPAVARVVKYHIAGMLKIKILLYNPVLHKAGNYSNTHSSWGVAPGCDGCERSGPEFCGS